jgi:flavin reductase (DIM6/NTAB) family NADH-FMN oxidoreductase RutF
MTVDASRFRQVLGRFATGVTIVTTRNGNTISGLTVSAFCSVSLEPPLVLVCIERRNNTCDLIDVSGIYAVSILAEDQQYLSRCFATTKSEKYDAFCGAEYFTRITGAPILQGCIAYLDCQVEARYPGGDHTIFLGRVLDLGLGENGRAEASPLLYFRGRYERLGHHEER